MSEKMKLKLILMKNVKYNYPTVAIAEGDNDLGAYDDEYVRLSEVINVEFTELDSKTVVDSQVAAIEKQITKVRADAEAAITALDGRKQELLAICHEG